MGKRPHAGCRRGSKGPCRYLDRPCTSLVRLRRSSPPTIAVDAESTPCPCRASRPCGPAGPPPPAACRASTPCEPARPPRPAGPAKPAARPRSAAPERPQLPPWAEPGAIAAAQRPQRTTSPDPWDLWAVRRGPSSHPSPPARPFSPPAPTCRRPHTPFRRRHPPVAARTPLSPSAPARRRPPAPPPPRSPEPLQPRTAARITSSGAASPVKRSKLSAPWATRIASPSTVATPRAAAASTSRVPDDV
jgi:hypothetical protein